MTFSRHCFALLAVVLLAACGPQTSDDTAETAKTASGEGQPQSALVPYENFTLDNGLNVLFHIDRSDPVVAVVLTAHVGSAREKPGRTGFAHMFEHLLFLECENLGKGGLDKMSARIGGSGANGFTSNDITTYFQTVPNDALEKMIWAEADKIGWFINTVTEPVLAKEKQVVKNEKRQSYDNRPYGHTNYVITKSIYPEDHPYSWEVIGSLADLDAATLDDVKEFYGRWYVPNNVTLTIAGDFDTEQARAWVEKYFAEIPRGQDVKPLPKAPGEVPRIKRLMHEDNFARLPALTMTWPAVPAFDGDGPALDVLMTLLAEGKTAPLNEVLIDEKKVTASVGLFQDAAELAGTVQLGVQALPGIDLDAVAAAIQEGFARFEAKGIAEKDLARVKTKLEVGFYGNLGSVLGKAFTLSNYEVIGGDAALVEEEIGKIQSVTAADVMRVYETYIKGRPYVATSFVPLGGAELALEGSETAAVVEEEIIQGAEEAFDPSRQAAYERTPSSFDRTQEPPYGDKPVITTPRIWETEFDNGLHLMGITDTELPLVRFELTVEGGQYVEPLNKVGVANLVAEVLDKGTAKRTTAELEGAVDALGGEIHVGAGGEFLSVSGSVLSRNFEALMTLVEEIVLEPRWDAEEFALAKARVISAIENEQADPAAIAGNAFALVTYGENHIFARNGLGTKTVVEALTLDDLKAYYDAYLVPNVSRMIVAGHVMQERAAKAIGRFTGDWPAKELTLPEYPEPQAPGSGQVFFYDVPGAKQSQFVFGAPALKRTDPDFFKAQVMNYILGGGGFASRLTQQLRETKGYTYGIGSGFSGTKRMGLFTVSSGVRSNVTLEAAQLIREIMRDYGTTFSEADLAVTKSFMTKSKAREFETLGAKLGLLDEIGTYDLPHDFVMREIDTVENMTRADVKDLAARYIRPDRMHYVVVGDGATQEARLESLGLGAPVRINERVDAMSE